MSSLWDAVFIPVLDRTDPLMLNLSGTPYIEGVPGKSSASRLVHPSAEYSITEKTCYQ
jgi:hypothetical protein